MQLVEIPVEIRSRDYWFKIVDFLQQNWALIDKTSEACTVFSYIVIFPFSLIFYSMNMHCYRN